MPGAPFTQEAFDRICDRIADGESLRTICLDDDMPGKSLVLKMLAKDDATTLRDQYALAREAQADVYVDEIIEIADDSTGDVKMTPDGVLNGLDAEFVARSRLRVDARKWTASKLAPKKYGDRVVNEMVGKDGGAIETKDVSEIDIAKRIAFALMAGAQK